MNSRDTVGELDGCTDGEELGSAEGALDGSDDSVIDGPTDGFGDPGLGTIVGPVKGDTKQT